MSVTFNANEVFEMAEQIERNGAKFYREAATNTAARDMKDMFLNMAAMEDGHLKTFEAMRKELAAQEKAETVFDPYNEATLYLQTMADSKGSEGLKSPTEKLTGNESAQELLEIAIGAEKNSVLFYVGLKDLVSAQAGRDKVEAIIREEVRHVADLRKQLIALNERK
ncbi:ferritin family protein [Anaerobaca lacustris]|uniref:Ferritin family protein n=1 Tax=Anaerobaca lacustris TaxID=3044600 RepID=A0AAW6TWM8_9BACT|nr:ferritin family protein [Sedimentisphaerales bacterium M17dextr]